MNTIQIITVDGPVNYTESEVVRFIEKAKEVDAVQQVADSYRKEIRDLRNNVRDFFSEGEWSDGEQTVIKSEVNDLLERIGTNKLTTKYNGTFTITGSFSIEVEDEDEIEDIITENTEISNWSADMDVDQIEVHDVEEDN
jgi:methionine synthase II (cobalamin-independent)